MLEKIFRTPHKRNNNFRGLRRKFLKKKRVGASLVEVLLVIMVIGLLFALLVPRIDFVGDKAREAGVKSDFRSYMLATEQLMREYSGMSKHATLVTAAKGLNLYLDPDLKIYSENNKDIDGTTKTGVIAGNSVKNDPWHLPYKMEITATAGTNNGSITISCGGKDKDMSTTTDNFSIITTYTDGVIKTISTGFSTNIE